MVFLVWWHVVEEKDKIYLQHMLSLSNIYIRTIDVFLILHTVVKSYGTAKLKMATLTYAQILAKIFACKSEEI